MDASTSAANRNARTLNLKAQALRLAQQGYRVLTIHKGQRVASQKLWPATATTDATKIKAAWSRQPRANIGVLTGHGLVVIDVDVKNGKNGLHALSELRTQYRLPKTRTVRTPSGGYHLYYRYDADRYDLRCATEWVPGIDIRANGGYVVAPGSRIREYPNPYRLIWDVPTQFLPEELQIVLDKPATVSKFGDIPEHIRATTAEDTRYVNALPESTHDYHHLPERIPLGSRDATLFSYACSWRERDLPYSYARVLVRAIHGAMEQSERDPYTLEQCLSKLQQVYERYEPSKLELERAQSVQPEVVHDVLQSQREATKVTTISAALDRFIYCFANNLVIDLRKHPSYAAIKMESFKNGYSNILLKTSKRKNAKVIELPKLWIAHANRQSVDDINYKPNGPAFFEEEDTAFYNLWAPSALQRQLQSMDAQTRSTVSTDKLDIFWRHLDLIFGQDVQEREAFWRWLAYAIRYPERRVSYGSLIISEPGLGKSWFYKFLQRMVGPHNINTIGLSELRSDFNDWLFGCSMIVVHELMTGDRQSLMANILSPITEDRVMINPKNKDRRMRNIYGSVLAFSNHANAAAIAAKDRRFFVYHSAARHESVEYYRRLFAWLDTEGPLQLLNYIQQMDLSDFNPGEAPMQTAAKARMIYANMSLVEQMIADAIEDCAGPFVADIVDVTTVTRYLEGQMDLDRKEQRHIQIVLSNLHMPLPQDRYRLPGDTKRTQYRLKVVRNGERWVTAPCADIVKEFQKALNAVGVSPSLSVVHA